VTFGVVPGVVMFQLLWHPFEGCLDAYGKFGMNGDNLLNYPAAFIAFLIPLFSALRLAKFNNDTRQSDSFIGVPTPANSILICSLPLVLSQLTMKELGIDGEMHLYLSRNSSVSLDFLINPYFLIGVTLVMSYLLISEIPLFALKVKGFGWKENQLRYSFLAISLLMLVLLKFIALPLIIVLYVLMSVGNNLLKKKQG
jgi:CDP-diacylglycerol--serine O-phosphatidyltransferase